VPSYFYSSRKPDGTNLLYSMPEIFKTTVIRLPLRYSRQPGGRLQYDKRHRRCQCFFRFNWGYSGSQTPVWEPAWAKTLFCLFADWHYAVLRETEFLAQLHSQIRRICRTEFGNEENHAVRNGFLTAQEAGEWQFAPTRILSTRIQLAHGDIRQPQIYT